MDKTLIIHKEIIENFINSIPSLFKYSNQPYGVSLEILNADGYDNPGIIEITNVTNQGMDLFFNFFDKLNFKPEKEFKTKRYFDDYYIKDHDMKLADEEYKNHHGWMKHFNKNYFIDRDTEYLKNASLIKMFSQKTQRTIFISDRSSEFIESDDKFKICTTKYEFRELI